MSSENDNQPDSSQKTDSRRASQTDDIYSIYEQNMQKYFENIRKNYPQYFQAVTDFQQEYIKTAEKTLEVMISTQREFINQSGMCVEISNDIKNALVNSSKQIIRANNMNNKIRNSIIHAMTSYLEAFRENVSSFADLNKCVIK